MAEIVSLGEVRQARRRALERVCTERCVEILEANLRLTLHLLDIAPRTERPVRARQVRQLAELLEYVVAR